MFCRDPHLKKNCTLSYSIIYYHQITYPVFRWMIDTWTNFVLLNHAVEKTPEYVFFFTYIKISLNLKGRELVGLESTSSVL